MLCSPADAVEHGAVALGEVRSAARGDAAAVARAVAVLRPVPPAGGQARERRAYRGVGLGVVRREDKNNSKKRK
jgi:hypothetical protein